MMITPLGIAAKEGHVDAIYLLLSYGANVNGCPDGIQPICNACWANSSEAVLLMIDRGATLSKGEWAGQVILARSRKYHALEVLCRIMYLVTNDDVTSD